MAPKGDVGIFQTPARSPFSHPTKQEATLVIFQRGYQVLLEANTDLSSQTKGEREREDINYLFIY